MRAPWTIGRVIAGSVSLLLLGFGAKCLVDGRRLSRDFERWQTEKPLNGAVDLSTPGRFVLPLHPTCSSAHGALVALRVPPEALKGATVTQLLAGLNARLEVFQGSDGTIVESRGSELFWADGTFDGAIPIFNIATLRQGAYEARVTVTAGAPALKGVGQQLEGRYVLCGLERLPAEIATGVGVVSAWIGAVAGFAVLMLAVGGRNAGGRGGPSAGPNAGPSMPRGDSGATEGSPPVR